ncbi:MAG TPA: ABC transporter ATP-binding protein [Phycisphaerae bacterium]|nr:ABC transporter ATP-binding protein [Phycisphaerae bacterium]
MSSRTVLAFAGTFPRTIMIDAGNMENANTKVPSGSRLLQVVDSLDRLLAGPAPTGTGPPAASLREWVNAILASGAWPCAEPEEVRRLYGRNVIKCHIRDLLAAWRHRPPGQKLSDETVRQIHEIASTLGAIGALLALNAPTSADDPSSPRYPIDHRAKRAALLRLLHGWRPEKKVSVIPPLSALLLDTRQCALSMVATKVFYNEMLACILDDARDPKKIPALLGRYLVEPAIVAHDAWVGFRIRFHSKDATLKDALSGFLRRRRDNGAVRRDFWALRGINLAAHPGETIGIIGRNGSGKTTFLKALAGILAPDRGVIRVEGKVGCLLSFGVGFNAHLSGRENVFLNGSILGMPQRDIAKRLDQIIAFSELGEFIDAPVRTYSAGMRGRLGFSIAIHIDPDILILDEVLTVGDDHFQKKAGSILDRFRESNKTVVIASHSMSLIRRVATRAIWLEKGEIRMAGDPTDVTRAYVADSREQREASNSVWPRPDKAPATAMQSPIHDPETFRD